MPLTEHRQDAAAPFPWQCMHTGFMNNVRTCSSLHKPAHPRYSERSCGQGCQLEVPADTVSQLESQQLQSPEQQHEQQLLGTDPSHASGSGELPRDEIDPEVAFESKVQREKQGLHASHAAVQHAQWLASSSAAADVAAAAQEDAAAHDEQLGLASGGVIWPVTQGFERSSAAGEQGLVTAPQSPQDGSQVLTNVSLLSEGLRCSHLQEAEPTMPHKGASKQEAAESMLLAISGEDGNFVELWDVAAGSVGRRYGPAMQRPQAAAVSIQQQAAQLQEPRGSSGAQGHKEKACGLAMCVHLAGTADAVQLAAGYEDGSVALWSSAAGPQVPAACCRLHTEPVMAVALSPTSEVGASGSADQQVILWTAIQSRSPALVPLARFPLPAAGVADVAFREDGRILIAGCWDGSVRLYHVKRREALVYLQYHNKAVTSLAVQPGSGNIVSAARDGLLAVWDVYTTTAK